MEISGLNRLKGSSSSSSLGRMKGFKGSCSHGFSNSRFTACVPSVFFACLSFLVISMVVSLSLIRSKNNEAWQLQRGFSSYDKNQDQVVSLHELGTVFFALGRAPSLPQLQIAIFEFDSNNDREVSLVEFLAAARRKRVSPTDGIS